MRHTLIRHQDGRARAAAGVCLAAMLAASGASAQCTGDPPGRSAYFGDIHVHTHLSFDAYIFDTPLGPEEAYDAAKGFAVDLAPVLPGLPNRRWKLGAPLDFAAVTDHSDFLGEVSLCTSPGIDPETFASDDLAQQLIDDGFNSQAATLLQVCEEYRLTTDSAGTAVLTQLCVGAPQNEQICAAAHSQLRSVWARTLQAAEQANAPCEFTTFAGYEWTGTTAEAGTRARNHRNVIFRDVESLVDGEFTPLIEPILTSDIARPSQMRDTLRRECLGIDGDEAYPGLPGCDVMAIPHSSNNSQGTMFQLNAEETAADRRAMEPLVEIFQHKSSSECAPYLDPDDPDCGFEPYILDTQLQETPDSVAPGFMRRGLGVGLIEEQQSGDNPFRVGFIGGTDTHNATPGAVEENNFSGHIGAADAGLAKRMTGVNATFNPGGLAGVWAEENTRDGIFEAFRRRETFATSGPRIRLRLAASWRTNPLPSEPIDLCGQLLLDGLASVTQMGSVLPAQVNPNQRPQLLLVAVADANSTDLARANIVKGWVDDTGAVHEEVIALPDAPEEGRRRLCRAWMDEDLDPEQPAYYYARVFELPTPRYSKQICDAQPQAWSCDGPEPPPIYPSCCDSAIYTDIEERAWSSPIYFSPSAAQ
ncbi:MAG: DUF3604 domain-containing protein [Pseudomonadota bacterium]